MFSIAAVSSRSFELPPLPPAGGGGGGGGGMYPCGYPCGVLSMNLAAFDN